MCPIEGMMILIGKHQFNVSSITDGAELAEPREPLEGAARTLGLRSPESLKMLVSDAEKLVADYEKVKNCSRFF